MLQSKKLWPFALIALGIAVFLCGFLYDILFAGIPYQDAPPELAARYALHAQIASTIRCTGGIGFLIGMGAVIVQGILRKMRK